jgi:hypothetical protein
MVEEPIALWVRLPPEVRDRIDTELRQHRQLQAILTMRGEGGLDPTPGLCQAQAVVAQRLRWLTERGEVEPEPVVSVAELVTKVRAVSERVAAIEALWDGDTEGWLVMLLAVIERPSRHHPRFDEITLALLRHGGDIRIFNGEVPPWPEAVEALQKGEALATALGVPFYFADPDAPDDELPRWWDQPQRWTASDPE